jgi:hypothetical protein
MSRTADHGSHAAGGLRPGLGTTLLQPRITRRVVSQSATIGDFCSGPTGGRSSSREPLAGQATMQKRGRDGRAAQDAFVIGDRRVA